MTKRIIWLFLPLLSLNSYALRGNYLINAQINALTEVSKEVPLKDVRSWEISFLAEKNDIMEALFRTKNNRLFKYYCFMTKRINLHYLECQRQYVAGHHMSIPDFERESIELEYNSESLAKAQAETRIAFAKVRKTLRSKYKKDFSIMRELKVWVYQEMDESSKDHAGGRIVYVKFSLELNEEISATYVQCHTPRGSGETECMYVEKGINEPPF